MYKDINCKVVDRNIKMGKIKNGWINDYLLIELLKNDEFSCVYG